MTSTLASHPKTSITGVTSKTQKKTMTGRTRRISRVLRALSIKHLWMFSSNLSPGLDETLYLRSTRNVGMKKGRKRTISYKFSNIPTTIKLSYYNI